MHRPSPATAISLVALVFAMSGTAVAATGGDFLLGKSNTATAVSTLTNTKGTALSLSSSSTAPPLKVSNSVQVPDLNASKLGGLTASGFVQGDGTDVVGRAALGAGANRDFLEIGSGIADAFCDVGGTGASLTFSEVDEGNPAQVIWWNKDGTSDIAFGGDTQSVQVSPVSEAPYMVVVQMDNGISISTYTLTATYDSTSDSCYFTGQAVATDG